MTMIKAGAFEIQINGPYPVFCSLVVNGERIATFPHTELSDLHYAIEKAMKEAKIKLGDRKDEV